MQKATILDPAIKYGPSCRTQSGGVVKLIESEARYWGHVTFAAERLLIGPSCQMLWINVQIRHAENPFSLRIRRVKAQADRGGAFPLLGGALPPAGPEISPGQVLLVSVMF